MAFGALAYGDAVFGGGGVDSSASTASIIGAGDIASGEAHGAATVTFGAAISGAGAVSSGEFHGTPSASFSWAVTAAGEVASAEAHGTHTVSTLGGGGTYFRPASDVSGAGWTPSAGTDLYACIDESTANEADYIWRLVASGGPATFGIGGSLPAGAHTVSFGAHVTSGSRQMRAVLLDAGGAVVGTGAWQTLTNAAAIYSQTITTTDAATMLRLEDQA